jgi:hypothetical protein
MEDNFSVVSGVTVFPFVIKVQRVAEKFRTVPVINAFKTK